MEYMKNRKTFRMEDEEEPKMPENPMEKMLSSAQFDKIIEQRKIPVGSG
jgi:hypothetical protein